MPRKPVVHFEGEGMVNQACPAQTQAVHNSTVLALALQIYLKIPAAIRMGLVAMTSSESAIYTIRAIDPCTSQVWEAQGAFVLDAQGRLIVLQFWDERLIGRAADDTTLDAVAIEVAAMLDACNRGFHKVLIQALEWEKSP